MAHPIKIPSVGESISSGTIAEWHVADGSQVSPGDLLLTLETDKISTEIEADQAGVIQIKVPAGEEVEIGAIVGEIDPSGSPSAAPSLPKEKAPEPAATKEVRKEEVVEIKPPPEMAASEQPKETTSSVPPTGSATGQKLEVVLPKEPKSPEPPAKPKTSSDGKTTRKRMSPLRRKIATHLVNAQQTAAILTTFNEADMGAIKELRSSVQESFKESYGVKLGFMSFFVKGVVAALKEVPQINASIDGEDIVQNHYYDIGVAVGTEKGLVVPVLRDCDQKSFADIEKDIVSYAERAREGKLTFDDLRGGVFTISNGGVYGSLLSTPILNPPQSGILGMHTIQDRPIAQNGQVVIRPMMNLALSYDHRLVDGKEAVTFLIRLKESLENPTLLFVGG